jgi:probable F420-dependent oxidoreductase
MQNWRNSGITAQVGDTMTDTQAGSTSGPNLGRFGSFGRGVTPQQAREIEALGYGAVWVGGSPPAELEWVEPILKATSTLQVATGIVNIWSAAAKPVAESFHRIDKAYPGRFLLGIGVGHPEAVSEYRKPSTTTACPPTVGWLPRWARGC